ncbi:hypothetical protein FRC14_002024 [Serendipita sp. 396]|nr:hypothetical protein FRC14_002024 [Serendipita sp. 396]KAG8785279.1 hypothetical protein FRC15_001664 [Serendipita sp. 397]KAG8799334.1 hypothetical protein FRC16_005331 [Serendipita sp. 398]KAG8824440.1 hypothetical protein FRC19_001789 [Serendipita sp. 401]
MDKGSPPVTDWEMVQNIFASINQMTVQAMSLQNQGAQNTADTDRALEAIFAEMQEKAREGLAQMDPHRASDTYPPSSEPSTSSHRAGPSASSHPSVQQTMDSQGNIVRNQYLPPNSGTTGEVRQCAIPGCNTTQTPEWRRGPTGAATVCNACGLVYLKLKRKAEQREREGQAEGRASGSPDQHQGSPDAEGDVQEGP